MNWLRKNVSSLSLTSSSKSPSQMSLADEHKEQPASWLEVFSSHYSQAFSIIQQTTPPKLWQQSPSPRSKTNLTNDNNLNKTLEPITADHVIAVFSHLEQMGVLLLAEASEPQQAANSIGPILEYIFAENCIGVIVGWSLSPQMGEFTDSCKLNLLKFYEPIVSNSQQPLLIHKPILSPLLFLLDDCSRLPSSEVEKHFVVLLNQLCVNISHNDHLLDFFFTKTTEEGPPKFSVFTLLINYLYREGNIGQLARDALLLILAVSRRLESVGHFISEHSNFCPVR